MQQALQCWLLKWSEACPLLQDLRDLFRVDPQELVQSTTQQQLHELHAADRKATPELQAHLEVLQTLPCFSGQLSHTRPWAKQCEHSGLWSV